MPGAGFLRPRSAPGPLRSATIMKLTISLAALIFGTSALLAAATPAPEWPGYPRGDIREPVRPPSWQVPPPRTPTPAGIDWENPRRPARAILPPEEFDHPYAGRLI